MTILMLPISNRTNLTIAPSFQYDFCPVLPFLCATTPGNSSTPFKYPHTKTIDVYLMPHLYLFLFDCHKFMG